MQRRNLKELNLLDDFLFGSMVNYPGIGEEFSRELLNLNYSRADKMLKITKPCFSSF